MQKNWYLIYTKLKCEKKVTGLLTKKKIECFYPSIRKKVTQIRKSRLISEPLFRSYVFIYITKEQIEKILQLEDVLSLVYWKGAPAIISSSEINMMRQFLIDHEEVKIEKCRVDIEKMPSFIDRPTYRVNGNLLKLKNQIIKVNLPSVGYTLIAQLATSEFASSNSAFIKEELSMQ